MHGDFAMRGHDGLYYILGRSDDTIKISGKRTGPAELEGLLIATGKVAEAAAFGIPHPVKGSAIVCACVPMPGVEANSDLADALASALIEAMGASYRPETILFVDDLPRTRNLKIMRRVLRAVFENKDPGDLSALANPEAVDRLREQLGVTERSTGVGLPTLLPLRHSGMCRWRGPESITTIGRMDSGLALPRAPE